MPLRNYSLTGTHAGAYCGGLPHSLFSVRLSSSQVVAERDCVLNSLKENAWALDPPRVSLSAAHGCVSSEVEKYRQQLVDVR